MHIEAEYLLRSLYKIHKITPPCLDMLANDWQAAVVLRNHILIGPTDLASSGLLLIATMSAQPGTGVSRHELKKYVDHYTVDDHNYRIGNQRYNDYKEG
jgi:hypothetical protein